MKLPDEYREILAGHGHEPTPLLAVVEATAGFPDLETVRERLLELDEVEAVEPHDDARWSWAALVRRDGDDWIVFGEPTRDIPPQWLDWPGLSEEEQQETRDAQWCVGVEGAFGERPLEDYHEQLKILHAAAPRACAMIDLASCRSHSGRWLADSAITSVPPDPKNLYTIHAVRPDEGQSGGYWLHTHGLLRCGSVEIEMLDIPRDHVNPLGGLLNVVAAKFLDFGVPEPNSPFEAGDGMPVVWLPWEQAVTRQADGILGTGDDREDEDHSKPSAVLFAPAKGILRRRYVGLSNYVQQLEDNPVFYISDMETKRRTLLASERFETFRAKFAELGEQEDWGFLIKLGYPVDDSREHLWFEVHGIEDGRIDATLLNQPYYIESMNEGDRGEHDLELLSDWVIQHDGQSFGPSRVYELP